MLFHQLFSLCVLYTSLAAAFTSHLAKMNETTLFHINCTALAECIGPEIVNWSIAISQGDMVLYPHINGTKELNLTALDECLDAPGHLANLAVGEHFEIGELGIRPVESQFIVTAVSQVFETPVEQLLKRDVIVGGFGGFTHDPRCCGSNEPSGGMRGTCYTSWNTRYRSVMGHSVWPHGLVFFEIYPHHSCRDGVRRYGLRHSQGTCASRNTYSYKFLT